MINIDINLFKDTDIPKVYINLTLYKNKLLRYKRITFRNSKSKSHFFIHPAFACICIGIVLTSICIITV